jgi:hypothetical protein
MGRAFYSQTYASAPVIHTEPEPTPTCERWTSWNHFDPDSEEFFQDAEYEAFIDPAQRAREQAAAITAAAHASTATGMSDLSDSISSADSMGEGEQQQQRQGGASTNNSPMAVGADDPAMLIAGVYTNRTARWANNTADADAEDDEDTMISSPTEWQPPTEIQGLLARSTYNNSASPLPTPPAFVPSQSTRSPALRRTMPISPITVTRTRVEHRDTDADGMPERAPSPVSPRAPATPPPMPFRLHPARAVRPMALATPSPPPSVTPRFYSWQHHRMPAVPLSPTATREREREGPLTNPLARMSFVRIDAGPTRVRIPNTVM